MILGNNRGIALVMVLLVIAVLLGITGASVFFSGLDLRIAKNHGAGTGALQAADAGIQHGLALLPVGTDFNSLLQGSVSGFPCASPCNGTTNKPTLTATLSAYSYSVVAENDPSDGGGPTNDTNRLVAFTSTATGPSSSQRKIKAFIGRSSTNSWAPPGAIYIPNANIQAEVDIHGSATVTGNDYNVDGTSGPATAIPGMAANNNSTRDLLKNGLTTPSNVTGAGYSPGPPVNPSVATTTSPLDLNALANGFLALPHSTNCTTGSALGTWAAPVITYCSGMAQYENNTSGVGVLIVDGELEIQDNFNFKGIIIVRGNEMRVEAAGSSTIYGAILITNNGVELEIEGGGAIRYSSQAISMVNSTWPGVLSQKAKIIAWYEPMQ